MRSYIESSLGLTGSIGLIALIATACDFRVQVGGSTGDTGPSMSDGAPGQDATVGDVESVDGAMIEVDGAINPVGRDGGFAGEVGPGSDSGMNGADGGPGAPDLGLMDSGTDGGPGPVDLGRPDSGAPAMVFQGSFVITNTIDQQTIAPYDAISGNLRIDAPGMTEVHLPNLETIGDSLVVNSNPDLVRFSMPRLRHIGEDFEVRQNDVLETFSLPALEMISEDLIVGISAGITIRTNPVLVAVELPALFEIGGQMSISQNGTSIWEVDPSDPFSLFDGLELISMPALTTVGYGIWISMNDGMTNLDLSALSSVDARNCVGVVNCLNVQHDISINSNFSLPQCQVDQLFLQLRAAGYLGGFSRGDNGSGTCN